MMERKSGERGSAMVMALGALTVLAIIAIVVVAVVVSEKRTTFAEYNASRSFYSADAATEAGINWIRHQYTPAAIVDTSSNVYVANTTVPNGGHGGYRYDVKYIRKRYRPGWSVEYRDYEYRVDAIGTSSQQSESNIELRATRLYREGY